MCRKLLGEPDSFDIIIALQFDTKLSEIDRPHGAFLHHVPFHGRHLIRPT